jgi:hypothetical protein
MNFNLVDSVEIMMPIKVVILTNVYDLNFDYYSFAFRLFRANTLHKLLITNKNLYWRKIF